MDTILRSSATTAKMVSWHKLHVTAFFRTLTKHTANKTPGGKSSTLKIARWLLRVVAMIKGRAPLLREHSSSSSRARLLHDPQCIASCTGAVSLPPYSTRVVFATCGDTNRTSYNWTHRLGTGIGDGANTQNRLCLQCL